jgi:NAD(P)-dependent dehydrogenase (short-subunit alcohol dehydrogenase family)
MDSYWGCRSTTFPSSSSPICSWVSRSSIRWVCRKCLVSDLLKKSQPSRIVNTSSLLAEYGTAFSVDKLHKYNGNFDLYTHSKLAIILFTKELAKRLEGSGVTVYSVHPGAVKTDIFRDAEGWAGSFMTALFKRWMNFFFKVSLSELKEKGL